MLTLLETLFTCFLLLTKSPNKITKERKEYIYKLLPFAPVVRLLIFSHRSPGLYPSEGTGIEVSTSGRRSHPPTTSSTPSSSTHLKPCQGPDIQTPQGPPEGKGLCQGDNEVKS